MVTIDIVDAITWQKGVTPVFFGKRAYVIIRPFAMKMLEIRPDCAIFRPVQVAPPGEYQKKELDGLITEWH